MFRARSIFLAVAALGLTGFAQAQAPAPAPAQASGPGDVFSASVEYVAPPNCPSGEDFKAVVVRRLGFDPFGGDPQKQVFVRIAAGERLEGRLEWRDAAGQWAGEQAFPARTKDCAELVRTMGFALAVQIHLLTLGQPPPEPEPDTTKTAEEPPASSKKADAPSSNERRETARPELDVAPPTRDELRNGERWSFAVGAGASLGLGFSPEATALGRVFGSAAWQALSLELGAEISGATSAERADGAGFSAHALLASVAACGTHAAFSLCALVKGGMVEAQGQGVDAPASPTGTLLQTGLRLGARQRLGSVFIAERFEGLANLKRWTVTLDDIPVWTAPVLAGTVGLDAGLIFQ